MADVGELLDIRPITVWPGDDKNQWMVDDPTFSTTATLTHRSIHEFLSSEVARMKLERYTRDFDVLDASCQTLLAHIRSGTMPENHLQCSITFILFLHVKDDGVLSSVHSLLEGSLVQRDRSTQATFCAFLEAFRDVCCQLIVSEPPRVCLHFTEHGRNEAKIERRDCFHIDSPIMNPVLAALYGMFWYFSPKVALTQLMEHLPLEFLVFNGVRHASTTNVWDG